MRQSVDIDLAFIRLGVTDRASEAEIRARADHLRASATRQDADRFLFEAIEEIERAGLYRIVPGRRRWLGDGPVSRQVAVLAGCLAASMMAGLVIGAGAATAGAPEALTRWLVGLAPLLAVPASLVIVGAGRRASTSPQGTLEA